MIRSRAYRQLFSKQTQAQIEIGLEIADLAKEEIQAGKTALESLHNLIRQCLVRDEGWKAFYVEKMEAIPHGGRNFGNTLEIFKAELEAELKSQNGDFEGAIAEIQRVIDKYIVDDTPMLSSGG